MDRAALIAASCVFGCLGSVCRMFTNSSTLSEWRYFQNICPPSFSSYSESKLTADGDDLCLLNSSSSSDSDPPAASGLGFLYLGMF